MPSLGQSSSNNNHSTLPDDSNGVNNPQTHTPDPTYYYPDGSAVFLVEGVLFKLQATLILPPNSMSPIARDDSQRYPTGVDNLPLRLTDSSGANPITLPNVTANQFRNYLFALLGSPSDPLYLPLLTDAKDASKHSRKLLIQYLDISCLARQFGKPELEEWARSQLRLVLKSTDRLARSSWDKDTLLRLRAYAHATGIEDFISSTRTFIEYFISISTDQTSGQALGSSNLDTCVQLYKDPSLPKDDPALFGCAFASILALGHQSTTWKWRVTQKDRIVFYAAQVQLVSISDQLQHVGWLQETARSRSWVQDVCANCQAQFEISWRASFGKCKGLKSTVPLQDVTGLARLPRYRQLLVSRWNPPETCAMLGSRQQPDPIRLASDPFVSFRLMRAARLNLEDATRPEPVITEGTECPRLKLPLDDIDRRIQQVYTELARRHKDIVSEITIA